MEPEDNSKRPLLLCTAFPSPGHFQPVLAIAAHMARTQLVDVVFVMPPEFKEAIEHRPGIEYVEAPNVAAEMIAGFQQAAAIPDDFDRVAAQMGLIFIGTLARRAKHFHEVLQEKSSGGRRKVVLLEDALCLASAPYRHWKAPSTTGPSPPAIGIGVTVLPWENDDAGPFMMGLPPDASASGRLRNRQLHRLVRRGLGYGTLQTEWEGALRECGYAGEVPEFRIWNTGYEAYDVVYQLSVPGAEYTLSDLAPNVQFAGALPREEPGPEFVYPSWWDELSSPNRRVVFVSQGTVNGNYHELVVPTMQAFSEREDVLVIATLGVPGAALPAEVDIPGNARVVDYIPYDVVLARTDVFVSNSGYGGFTHAIRNGVPMVAAGETEDKKEIALRVAYSGAGLSLGTQTPSVEQIREGVEQVLVDPAYKRGMEGLMKESESLNCLKMIEDKVVSFLA